jgi:succinate dehydrogenase / fumarate reductase membrane anchor subunit
MPAPYLSTRTGSTQWVMQRVSAVLLVALAFGHFFIQHFTTDAVSTGLTVAARLNDPWWQAYYVLFIVLALYHGVNGLVGILRDYAPPVRLRFVGEVALWTLAAYFGARGIANLLDPIPLGEVKASYAARGFPAGTSVGNPPSLPKEYSFRDELRELHLLDHYLAHHVHRTEAATPAEVFGGGTGPADAEAVRRSGEAFDRWCKAVIAAGNPAPEKRARGRMFSSSYEFAVWAAAVRRADAIARGATPAADVLPAYTPNLH